MALKTDHRHAGRSLGRSSIIRRLKNIGLTGREAETAVSALVDAMIDGLRNDEKVVIARFGSLTTRRNRPRSSKLPYQPPHRVPARRSVRFKPSPSVFESAD